MNPMPSDGATDVLLTLAHSWAASDPNGETLGFDVSLAFILIQHFRKID